MESCTTPGSTNTWRVVVHMKYGYKITYEMSGDQDDGLEEMAHEQARMAIESGQYVTDKRGVRTYYPPTAIQKVKVVPPGVELESTKRT